MQESAVYAEVEWSSNFGRSTRAVLRHGIMDGGLTRVRFVLGPRDHTVTIHHPTEIAPDQLQDWCESFRQFVEVLETRNETIQKDPSASSRSE